MSSYFSGVCSHVGFATVGQAYPDTVLEGQSAAGLAGIQAEAFASLNADPQEQAVTDDDTSMLVVCFSMPETREAKAK